MTLALNVTFTGNVTALNSTNQARTWNTGSSQVPVTATGPASTVVTLTAISNVTSGLPAIVSAGAGQQVTRTGQTVSESSSAVVNSSNFGLYSGGGQFNVAVATGDVEANGSGQAGLFYAGGGVVSGSVSVTYSYIQGPPNLAPEPATLGLLAVGMAGFTLRRRNS